MCTLEESIGSEREKTFSEVAKLLDISEEDIEEWIILAMSHGIIDAKIDQLEEKVIIKTTTVRQIKKDEWIKIQEKIRFWKQRFLQLENVLQVESSLNQ